MLPITANALQILKSRYLKRDAKGRVAETPEDMFRRVANTMAKAELQWGNRQVAAFWGEQFFRAMFDLDFLPNSPTLMNAGFPNGQLSACFVLPIEDSLDSIFTTLKNAALIHQSGGGTGFSFSKLRPKGDIVSAAGGTSSGSLSFLRIFNMATEEVKQGGKRRGANMGILDISHPDMEEFILSKSDGKSLRNFNLSVAVSDAFMEVLDKNGGWDLVNPRTGETVKNLKASGLWNLIVKQAWSTGDPGLIFTDTINRHNPTPQAGEIHATNPCGEMPLLDYESCNLGSVNLSRMLKNEGEKTEVDWDKLAETVSIAIRFLDDVVEANSYLLPEIEEITLANRKIGLGVMGWAEMLLSLGIPYASEEAVQLAGQVMRFIQEKSLESSASLANERGVFPNWNGSIYAPDWPLRNASRTSIAPTGTISILAGTSSSIEPLFALAFRRVGILEGQSQTEVSRLFQEKMKTAGLWSEQLAEQVSETGSLTDVPCVPADFKNLFKTALEIPWQYHLRHQLAFQEFTDSAVSKTINLPSDATEKDVADIFQTAWKSGAKGITVYRCGSKEEQVLQLGSMRRKPCG